MFNYIRLSDGGTARHVGAKSEVEVIATIAAEVAARAGPQIQLVVALLLVPAVLLLVAAALLPAIVPAR
jgi:tight adherence protein C